MRERRRRRRRRREEERREIEGSKPPKGVAERGQEQGKRPRAEATERLLPFCLSHNNISSYFSTAKKCKKSEASFI